MTNLQTVRSHQIPQDTFDIFHDGRCYRWRRIPAQDGRLGTVSDEGFITPTEAAVAASGVAYCNGGKVSPRARALLGRNFVPAGHAAAEVAA